MNDEHGDGINTGDDDGNGDGNGNDDDDGDGDGDGDGNDDDLALQWLRTSHQVQAVPFATHTPYTLTRHTFRKKNRVSGKNQREE